jgi:hypothetical protein
MARSTKRRKFSNNQTVVFRFGDRNIVGQVVFSRPIGKRFIYDIAAEDGKIYYELPVDMPYNETIDTYLTRLFYKKYKMDEDGIPEIEDEDGPILNVTNASKSLIEVASTEPVEEEEEVGEFELDEDDIMIIDEDADPNW